MPMLDAFSVLNLASGCRWIFLWEAGSEIMTIGNPRLGNPSHNGSHLVDLSNATLQDLDDTRSGQRLAH